MNWRVFKKAIRRLWADWWKPVFQVGGGMALILVWVVGAIGLAAHERPGMALAFGIGMPILVIIGFGLQERMAKIAKEERELAELVAERMNRDEPLKTNKVYPRGYF